MCASRSLPLARSRRIIFRGPPAVAIGLARLFPHLSIIVFHHHWPTIDEGRRAALSLGLADRVHIHHIAAAGHITRRAA